jgi:hypothetical protein
VRSSQIAIGSLKTPIRYVGIDCAIALTSISLPPCELLPSQARIHLVSCS